MTDENTKKYEVLYFTAITHTPEELEQIKNQVNDIVTKNDGKIVKEEEPGKRKLAYMIKNTRHGYFILNIFNAPVDKVNQISHEIKLIPEVLRHRLMISENYSPIKIDMTETTEKKPEEKPITTPEPKKVEEKPEEKKEKVDLADLDLKIDKLLSDTEDNL